LDQSQRNQVMKKIRQVAENPLPRNEGGYGDPLGSKSSTQLSGYCKIELVKAGLRVVYRLVIENSVMRIFESTIYLSLIAHNFLFKKIVSLAEPSRILNA